MRDFDFARKLIDGVLVKELDDNGNEQYAKAFPDAQLPEYQTRTAACADFFCAEEVAVPSVWKQLYKLISLKFPWNKEDVEDFEFKPTLIHTGIKAHMNEDEVLEIVNRSSGPKRGLILANSIGEIDHDYADNTSNDGEIMFAYYNIKPWDITIKVGDRIGQGSFKKVLRPEKGLRVKDVERTGGFGSTGKN